MLWSVLQITTEYIWTFRIQGTIEKYQTNYVYVKNDSMWELAKFVIGSYLLLLSPPNTSWRKIL